MWIIPSQVGPWELVLDARDSLFHTERPELTDDQIRFVVDVEERPHLEALTWEFQGLTHNSATMQMSWGTHFIPIQVEAPSILPDIALTREEGARYVGEWQVTFVPDDSGQAPPPTVLTFRQGDDGALYGSFPPGAFGPPPSAGPPAAPDPEDATLTPQERERAAAREALAAMESGAFEYVLVPRAEGIFLFGYAEDGVLLEVGEIYHEFEFDGDRAVRLTVRNPEDRVFMTATRGTR